MEREWGVVVSEGGDWDVLEDKLLGPLSFEGSAMLFLQKERKDMRVECDEESWRGLSKGAPGQGRAVVRVAG